MFRLRAHTVTYFWLWTRLLKPILGRLHILSSSVRPAICLPPFASSAAALPATVPAPLRCHQTDKPPRVLPAAGCWAGVGSPPDTSPRPLPQQPWRDKFSTCREGRRSERPVCFQRCCHNGFIPTWGSQQTFQLSEPPGFVHTNHAPKEQVRGQGPNLNFSQQSCENSAWSSSSWGSDRMLTELAHSKLMSAAPSSPARTQTCTTDCLKTGNLN